MIQINPFSDKRHDYCCAYCGDDAPNTRDHVPSRVLLDEPFPENLPVVGCCKQCNSQLSLDEEYFAAAIECMLHSTSEPENLSREKIKAILRRNIKLKERIASSFFYEDPVLFPNMERHSFFRMERLRIENVVTKLAKGHVKFELSTPMYEPPSTIIIKPVDNFSDEEYNFFFFEEQSQGKFPEIGSRSFMKMCIDTRSNSTLNQNWITVQDGRYEYCVIDHIGRISVKILLSNYLVCYVEWRH
jgi:hypothetical protein